MVHNRLFPTTILPGQRSKHRFRLHWLLLLSLLLQSVAPTVWAASRTLKFSAEHESTENGIWTISCAGKPMWLPIPQLAEGQTGAISGAQDHTHSDNSRHCLICNNLAGTDTLLAGTDPANCRRANAAVAYDRYCVAIGDSHSYQLYQSRAPPVYTNKI